MQMQFENIFNIDSLEIFLFLVSGFKILPRKSLCSFNKDMLQIFHFYSINCKTIRYKSKQVLPILESYLHHINGNITKAM